MFDVFLIQVLEVALLDHLLPVQLLSELVQKSMLFLRVNCANSNGNARHFCRYSIDDEVMGSHNVAASFITLSDGSPLPEATLVQSALNNCRGQKCNPNGEDAAIHNVSNQDRLRKILLRLLYWLPSDLVQALITMIAAFFATFLLFMYLFVLLPVMAPVLAWLVLLVPMLRALGWWIYRDLSRGRHRSHSVADIAVVRGEDPLTTKSKEDVVELGDQSRISPICAAGIPDLGTTPLDHTNLASIISHSSEERVGSIQWSYIENSDDECESKDCSERC